MTMSRDEIYQKVQGVLVDALGVDEEEVTPNATLGPDLGAESIDYLDIVFRLEKAFGIKIPRGELFPENMAQMMGDERYVKDGRVTSEGLAALKAKLPFTDLSDFEKDPTLERASGIINVDTIVNYMASKVGSA